MLAMTENGYVELQLPAVLFPDTAITEGHWKYCGAVPMAHAMPVPSCMELFVVLVLIWAMTVLLLTHWNLRAALLYEQQDSVSMDKLEGNSGLVLGVGITT